MSKKAPSIPEELLREWPPVGKYRVRLVHNPRRPDAGPVLDIREYVSSDSFEGFTRRGIRLSDQGQIDLLVGILAGVKLKNQEQKP